MKANQGQRPNASGKEAVEPAAVEGRQEASAKKGLPHDTVQKLSQMIKDLEDQLDRMLAINDALEKDLDKERKRRTEIERSADRLEEQLRRAEQEAATLEDMRAEVAYLNSERSRLAATIEELGRHLAEVEQENRKLLRQGEQLKAERDDVLEDLSSVEGQFERGMEMVADLRTRLAVLGEERDALKGRLKLQTDKLGEVEEERDALLSEVDESRKALEEIRRSLADACVMSQRRTEPAEE